MDRKGPYPVDTTKLSFTSLICSHVRQNGQVVYFKSRHYDLLNKVPCQGKNLWSTKTWSCPRVLGFTIYNQRESMKWSSLVSTVIADLVPLLWYKSYTCGKKTNRKCEISQSSVRLHSRNFLGKTKGLDVWSRGYFFETRRTKRTSKEAKGRDISIRNLKGT